MIMVEEVKEVVYLFIQREPLSDHLLITYCDGFVYRGKLFELIVFFLRNWSLAPEVYLGTPATYTLESRFTSKFDQFFIIKELQREELHFVRQVLSLKICFCIRSKYNL